MTARRQRLTARQVLDRAVTEAALEAWLVQLCAQASALAYHTHDSRRSPAGYPDWTIVTQDARLAFVELKRETGHLTPAQEQWSTALGQVAARVNGGRVAYFVVRPSSRENLERWLL